jgi:non-specific serine/threonine protein kinase
MTAITLKDFQVTGVEKMMYNEKTHNIGSILSFDMGLGKTLTMAYLLIEQKKKEKSEKPDLIIVPLAVLEQWKKEILRLDNTKNVFIYHGPDRVIDIKNKMECKEKPVDMVITTYYSLVTRELEIYSWNRVVLDEAHIIRNGIETKLKKVPKTAIGAFAISHRAKYCYCVTGTPYNNSVRDILSLMKFVGYKGDDVVKFIDTFVIQKTKQDLMDPINVETLLIDRPKDGLDDYNKLYCTYIKISALLRKKQSIVTLRELFKKSMRLMAKLRMYCDIMQIDTKTYIYSEDVPDADLEDCDDSVFTEIEFTVDENIEFYDKSVKIKTIYDKLIEMLPTVPNKRIIIFSSFVTILKILESIINKKNTEILTYKYTGDNNRKERDIIVSAFTNEKETRPMVLLASLGAGSVGLNLVPCSTVFLADVSMNPFDELQAINRVHRITQKNKVNVIRFCMKHMIEESILTSHQRKFAEAKEKGIKMI